MPIHKVEGGWKWGEHGHVYATRAGAEAQAAAAYAHGYKGDAAAAGIALRAPSGRLLFLKRSDSGDHPGEWCFPGGTIEAGETAREAAARELYEEAGIIAAGHVEALDDEGGFVTFSGEADFEVKPVLNLEHTEFVWADPTSPPQPLHPGVAEFLGIGDAYDPDEPRDPDGKWTGSMQGHPFKVFYKGNLAGEHKTREGAEKRVARIIAMSRGKLDPKEVTIEEHHTSSTKDFAGFYAPEKIGKSRRVTPEGYLVLEGTPIARTGQQIYSAKELTGIEANGSGYIVVERLPEEVFREETLASFEGKDFVINHPPEGVDTENWKNHTVGHVQNVRRGEGIEDDLVLADIIVKDPLAIEYVNKELPELSAGYVADYEQTEPGKAIQRNIIGNHVAGVQAGRAGARVAVRDHSISEVTEMATAATRKKFSWQAVRERLIALGLKSGDADIISAEFNTDAESMDAELMKTISDMKDSIKALGDRMDSRDAAEKEERERKEKEAKDTTAAENNEGAEYEETGDTILEAETVGHVLNLGKTWTGGMMGDAAAQEPVLPAVIARAELLAPGIAKPTVAAIKGNGGKVLGEFMRSALKVHSATADGAANIANFTVGTPVDQLKGSALVGVFNGAAQLVRAKNNQKTLRLTVGTRTGDFSKPKTIDDINKANRDYWATQNRH